MDLSAQITISSPSYGTQMFGYRTRTVLVHTRVLEYPNLICGHCCPHLVSHITIPHPHDPPSSTRFRRKMQKKRNKQELGHPLVTIRLLVHLLPVSDSKSSTNHRSSAYPGFPLVIVGTTKSPPPHSPGMRDEQWTDGCVLNITLCDPCFACLLALPPSLPFVLKN